MITAFATGPGFFAANTRKVDASIPVDVVRIYCARIEAYDMPRTASEHELNSQFELLVAKATTDPRVARALLSLGENITANKHVLLDAAR